MLAGMESDSSVPARPPSDAPAAPPAEPGVSVAEDLPALNRAILDRVAGLERAGARAEAARIRHEATDAYSNAWDESARRILVTLLVRAERSSATPVRSRGWSLRRRSEPAR
jgi:hypothetical protein